MPSGRPHRRWVILQIYYYSSKSSARQAVCAATMVQERQWSLPVAGIMRMQDSQASSTTPRSVLRPRLPTVALPSHLTQSLAVDEPLVSTPVFFNIHKGIICMKAFFPYNVKNNLSESCIVLLTFSGS
jgi:hypothetical protein